MKNQLSFSQLMLGSTLGCTLLLVGCSNSNASKSSSAVETTNAPAVAATPTPSASNDQTSTSQNPLSSTNTTSTSSPTPVPGITLPSTGATATGTAVPSQPSNETSPIVGTPIAGSPNTNTSITGTTPTSPTPDTLATPANDVVATTPTTTTPSTPSTPMATSPQTVQFSNTQTGEAISAVWYPPAVTDGKAKPVIVALHGCGGLWSSNVSTPQKMTKRFIEYTALFQKMGFGVLFPDSFTMRNLTNVCQTAYADRTLTTAQRAGDASGALQWLATQPNVDVNHVGLVGWSNGASTSLQLLMQQATIKNNNQPVFASTALFYPGCANAVSKNKSLGKNPLLIQIGALDDWTPAADCEKLQTLRQAAGEPFELKIYPDSYHDFDTDLPVILREDVPNGINGSMGVHRGGNAIAYEQAKAEIESFLTKTLVTP